MKEATLERLLAGLSSRVFLMQNAHEDAPVLFQTRWALSYLSGPLTGDQITRLMADRRPDSAADRHETDPRGNDATTLAADESKTARPTAPAEINERFLPVVDPPSSGERLVYRPAIGATATLHYANAKTNIDEWQEVTVVAPLWSLRRGSPWTGSVETADPSPVLHAEPEPGATFAPLLAAASNAKSYTKWTKMLSTHLYRSRPLRLWRCRKPPVVSRPGDTERDFKSRLRDTIRETRDLAVEKLRRRYAPKLARLQDRITKAEQKVDVEREQYSEKKTQAAISIGATVVGAWFGRKLGSLGTLGRATTAMRGTGRAAQQRGDIARAKERVGLLRQQLRELEQQFEDDRDELQSTVDVESLNIKELKVACRKTDLDIQPLMLVWVPFRVDPTGIAQVACDLELG
jgi:hypothetical protein